MFVVRRPLPNDPLPRVARARRVGCAGALALASPPPPPPPPPHRPANPDLIYGILEASTGSARSPFPGLFPRPQSRLRADSWLLFPHDARDPRLQLCLSLSLSRLCTILCLRRARCCCCVGRRMMAFEGLPVFPFVG